MEERAEEKTIYELFWVSIVIKAIGSVVEMMAGLAVVFVPSGLVLHTALLLTQGDIDGDTDDFIANTLVHAAHAFAASNSLFIGVYFFMRGLIQFVIVIALFRNKLWAYPALIIVLLVLIFSQVYDIYLSHSLATILITLVDLITIVLVAREYKIVNSVRRAI